MNKMIKFLFPVLLIVISIPAISQIQTDIDSLQFYTIQLKDTVKRKNVKKIKQGRDIEIFMLDTTGFKSHYIYENILQGNFIEAQSPERIDFLKLDETKVIYYRNGNKVDHSNYYKKGEIISLETNDIHFLEQKTKIGKVAKITGIISIATTLFLAPVVSVDFKNQIINEVSYFNLATIGIAGAALSAGVYYSFGKKRFYFFNHGMNKRRPIYRPISTKK